MVGAPAVGGAIMSVESLWENILNDFRKGRQKVTGITLAGIAYLAKGLGRYTYKDKIFGMEEVIDALKKLSEHITPLKYEIKDINPMSIPQPLGRLVDVGILERVSTNPARYKIKADYDTLMKIAGAIIMELIP